VGTSIDNRVVAMKFDNQQFEKGVKTTMNSLGELNKGLQFEGIGKGIDTIASKFTAFHVAGFTAIQEITKGLINLGKKAVGAMLNPLVEGGKKRALSIEQAKFQFKGLGMDVEATMESALAAVRGTAFGLDEAAMAAAMFGATGLRAGEEMTAALRGISGVAAMSGSGYSDVADVFTKVAGQGRVMGDDLNRLASRGINAAATLGKAMGKTEADVRKMVSKGEIDFKTFAKVMDDAFGEHATKASETYAGSLKNLNAAFARIGAKFYTNQFEALRRIFVALTPVIDGVASAIGPIIDVIGNQMLKNADSIATWLESFNFKNAENWLKPVSKGFENLFGIIERVATPILRIFRDIFPPKTGKDILLFSIAFEKFTEKLEPSVKTVRAIVYGFKDFLIVIRDVGKFISNTIAYLKELIDFGIVFRGIFAIFSLGWQVIKFVVEALYSFVDVFFLTSGAANGVAKTFANVIESFFQFFINLNESADKGKVFNKALNSIRSTLENIAVPVKAVADWVRNLVTQFRELIGPLGPVSSGFTATGNAALFFSKIIQAVATVIGAVITALEPLIKLFKSSMEGVTLDDILKTILTATTVGLFASINGFLTKFFELFRGVVPSFRFFFNELAFSLKSFSASITASALKQIAIAILILAVAMFILASLDAEAAKRGAGGVGVILMMLAGFMQVNKKIGKVGGLETTALGLILLGTALTIMASAVKKMGELEPEVLQRGLLGIAALLGGLAIFTKIVNTDKGLVRTGVGFIMFAIALRILASVLGVIGEMDQAKLTKAMVTLGLIFAAVAGFSHIVDPTKFISMGIGMVLLAASMKILASALQSFSGMSWDEIGRGLTAMAGGLILMVGAMRLMPKGAMTKATGLLIVSAAIYILGEALSKIGSMSWDELARSLVGVGVALVLILAFLALAGNASILLGAVALGIVSAALFGLAIVLKMIGAMSIESIAKGLGTIALALTILIVAGYAATGAIVGLLGLGAAILLIGVGVFLAGAGIGMLAAGIGALIVALTAGGAVIIAFAVAIAQSLPEMAKSLARAIGSFAEGLYEQQTVMTKALTAMLESVLDGLITIIPKVVKLFSLLMDAWLELVVEKTPVIVQAVLDMLIAVMESIRDNIPKIVELAGEIIVAYLDALGDYYVKIAAAGADFIIKIIEGISKEMLRITNAAMDTVIKFINGLTTAIRTKGAMFDTAVKDLLSAIFDRAARMLLPGGLYDFMKLGANIVDGIKQGILDGIGRVGSAIAELVRGAFNRGKEESDSHSPSRLFMQLGGWWADGLIVALEQNTKHVATAAGNVVRTAYDAMASAGQQALNVFDGLESPTITPVVNLDSVYEGAKAISALMSDASSINVSGAVDSRMSKTGTDAAAASTQTGNTVEATLIQNNYSPKALSRLEIYRQTKNQLQLLKGLGG
jgi:tape measure domain-containing protein